jgi:hypothetical protein
VRALAWTCAAAAAALAPGCCFGEAAAPADVQLEGPLRAEITFVRDRWGGLWSSLRVEAPMRASMNAGCLSGSSPQLVGDGTTHRLAYRCAAGEPWRLVYVGPSRLIVHCASPLGSGPAPELGRAPVTFVDAAPELAGCARTVAAGMPGAPFPALFGEAAALGTDEVVRALLLTRPFSSATGWESAAAGLSEDARAQLRDRLRAELADEPASNPRMCRAVGVLGADDEAVLAHAPALVGSRAGPGVCSAHTAEVFAAWARHDPEPAAAAACARIRGLQAPVGPVLAQATALRIVAESGQACDVRGWIEGLRCYDGLRCGDVMCSDPADVVPGRESVDYPEAADGFRDLLRVALRAGPLPPEWIAREGCTEPPPR